MFAGIGIGHSVVVLESLNVRTSPTTSAAEIADPDYGGFAPTGTSGVVRAGPILADGWKWLYVEFAQGKYAGWSVEPGFKAVSAPPPSNGTPPASDQPADLYGALFIVREKPLNAGDSFEVTFAIGNDGAAASGFWVDFYVSTNSSISSQDYWLSNYYFDYLPSSSCSSERVATLKLPAQGNWFWKGNKTYTVGMAVDPDGRVNEGTRGERNNANRGTRKDRDAVWVGNTVMVPPDLSGSLFDVPGTSLRSGQEFDVNFEVKNTGSAAGAFTVSYFLSKDSSIKSNDYLLGTFPVSGVNAKSTVPFSTKLVLPNVGDLFGTRTKKFYIGMRVDSGNTVAEGPKGERNNGSTGTGKDRDYVFIDKSPLAPTGVTIEQLQRIMPYLRDSDAARYIDHLNRAMAEFEINTPLRRATFLAQLAHESGELRYWEELASGVAYEYRSDLGNTEPGDGPRFKGHGPIQITGRTNHRDAGAALGLDLVNNPTLIADSETHPEYGFRAAGWYWKKKGLNELADAREFDAITYRINGGFNGYNERWAYYDRALTVLGVGVP